MTPAEVARLRELLSKADTAAIVTILRRVSTVENERAAEAVFNALPALLDALGDARAEALEEAADWYEADLRARGLMGPSVDWLRERARQHRGKR